MRPRVVDLYCNAGGAGWGYYLAGFDVTGVDVTPHPDYPFTCHEADALTFDLSGFDAVHASPPCQAKTTMSNRWRGKGTRADEHVDLIAQTRDRLEAAGVPWVIENVPGAAGSLRNPLVLTGGQFGLGVHRPRLFESNVLLLAPARAPAPAGSVGVYGKHPDGRLLWRRGDGSEQRAASSVAEAQAAMGMPWCNDWRGLAEAIPPAYTEFIGSQLLSHIGERAA